MTGAEALAGVLREAFPEATFDVAIVDGDLHVMAYRAADFSPFVLRAVEFEESSLEAAGNLIVAIGEWVGRCRIVT